MRPVLTLALGRPTFDVPFAQETAARAFAALEARGVAIRGPRDVLFDADSARAALAAAGADHAGALILQTTFTDAAMSVEIARAFPHAPLSIWAFPEPRAGGRLRLNAFCGLNLAAHALGRAGVTPRWFHGDVDHPGLDAFLAALAAPAPAPASFARPARTTDETARAAGARLDARLAGRRIGLVGEHPAGFDTCRFESGDLRALAGIDVEPIALGEAFAMARAVPADDIAKRAAAARETYSGLDDVDQQQLGRSFALHAAFEELTRSRRLDALAVRCWPETFTDYGCAACGPMGMLTEAGSPCACEADMFGALTALLLQEAAGAPPWLVDIVDMAEDSAVLWHCGSAPLSMRDPDAPVEAQIHSNRKMPLLAQFPLKPGRITLARVTQARNRLALALGAGEVLRAPMSFTGTSAVVRLDGGGAAARARLLDAALEHHVAIVYGDHRAALEAWAARCDLPLIDLTA